MPTARRLARSVALVMLLSVAAAPSDAQTTGLVPINDLGAGSYLGNQGGLYPGGVNTPPAAHLDSALAQAAEIVPRDAAGRPDPNGWIGMIAVGMSNTTHEFGAFERNADADVTRNARVIIMDTGFGGQTATTVANPNSQYWTTVSQRVAAMGLTAAQVQVAWLKEAEAQPANNFPVHAQALRDTLKRVVKNLLAKYPNLKICYLSSRIYGGYSAQGGLNPEPQAYESGFSVKWLIEDQIAGDPELNYGQLPGDARAPLLLWGPYLWADGVNPRSDGLVWLLGDVENDHVHPSPAGEQKVARMLADFFANDPTTASWWPAQPDARLVTLDATDDSYVSAGAPGSNFDADSLLLGQGGVSPIDTYLRFDLSGETRPILHAKLSLRVFANGGGAVRRVEDTSWDESTLTYSNAPTIGPLLVSMPQSSRDGTIGADVRAVVRSDPDDLVSFAVTTAAMSQTSYHDKEAAQPPRLVLVVSQAVTSVAGSGSTSAGHLRVSPNPALGEARVSFDLPVVREVDLGVYSVDGRRVRTLASGIWPAGRHLTVWDGRDSDGRAVPPGLYFARFSAGGPTESRKLVRIQ